MKTGSMETGERSFTLLQSIRSILASQKAPSICEAAAEIVSEARSRARTLFV